MEKRRAGVWRWAIGGLLLLGLVGGVLWALQRGVVRAREPAYEALVAWLQANALPEETVAVEEPRLFARALGAERVLALPESSETPHLLAALRAAPPDYVVTLRSVAWEGVRIDPWFQEHYLQGAVQTDPYDSASPFRLYRLLHIPFDEGVTTPLDYRFENGADDCIVVQSYRLSATRLEPGGALYVTVVFTGTARESLRSVLQLVGDDGRVVAESIREAPGGLPTDFWPAHEIEDRTVLGVPASLPVGEYRLALGFCRPNDEPLGGPLTLATLSRPPEVGSAPPAPDHAVQATLGEGAIDLVGYDGPTWVAPGETLSVAVYWHALAAVPGDDKVFVHILGADGLALAQDDAKPVGWTYPTTAWQPGEFIRDVHRLTLDAAFPRGDFWVAVGMYDAATGIRLPVRDAQGAPLADAHVLLYRLHVR